jgi:mono/diheme cytochrome c family protein
VHRDRSSGVALILAVAVITAHGGAGTWNAPSCRAASPAPPPLVAGFERFGRPATDDAGRIEAGLLLVGELGCSNCHTAPAAIEAHVRRKRGPLLDTVGERIDPAWLAKYLAAPHVVAPGTTMPDVLASLPDDERAATVTALTHFLAATGSSTRGIWPGARHANANEGRAVYDRVGCAACHGALATGAEPLPDQRPLAGLDAKWNPAALEAFLRDPLIVRPSSRMPAVHLNDDERRHVVAALVGPAAAAGRTASINAFTGTAWLVAGERLPDLAALGKPARGGPVNDFDVAALAGRHDDFVVRLDGFLHVPQAGRHRFHLTSDDGSRLAIGDRTIIDNDGIHPITTMEGEADLAAGVHPIRIDFFQRGGGMELALDVTPPDGRRSSALDHVTPAADGTPAAAKPSDPAAFRLDAGLVGKGRAAFAAAGCASCHGTVSESGATPAVAARPLGDLPAAAAGCLTDAARSGMARFGLDDAQRDALVAALRWLATPAAAAAPPRELAIARTFTSLNCYACHNRDGRGGTLLAVPTVDDDGEPVTVDERRDRLFTTHVKELGEEGRLPPSLTGVGDKLDPKFLATAILEGSRDRGAYMHTRMPGWHADVARPLVALLGGDVTTTAPVPALAGHRPQDVADAGRFLIGSKGLGCVKCHSYDGDRGQSLGVIAMTRFPARLRHEWYLAYVADPQKFRPGTRMPASWPEGKAFFPDLVDGTAAGQIEAVWRSLTASDRRPPLGARGETIELVPGDQPVIYRNFIEGAGPRAIGVGYPERVNLAWDAETMRLPLVWRGAFMDAGRHWSGRGEGWQPPLGDGVFKPDAAAAVDVLTAGDAAWPQEPPRARGARFLGYTLDKAGRPAFRWSIAGMDVTEAFEPAVDAGRPLLRRTLRLRGRPAAGEAVFRAARAKTIEDDGDGWLRIDGQWRVRMAGGLELTRVEQGDRTELRCQPVWVVASVAPGGAAPPAEALIVEELSW